MVGLVIEHMREHQVHRGTKGSACNVAIMEIALHAFVVHFHQDTFDAVVLGGAGTSQLSKIVNQHAVERNVVRVNSLDACESGTVSDQDMVQCVVNGAEERPAILFARRIGQSCTGIVEKRVGPAVISRHNLEVVGKQVESS